MPTVLKPIIMRLPLLLGCALVSLAIAVACSVTLRRPFEGERVQQMVWDSNRWTWEVDRYNSIGYERISWRVSITDIEGDELLHGSLPHQIIPSWSDLPKSPFAVQGQGMTGARLEEEAYGWPWPILKQTNVMNDFDEVIETRQAVFVQSQLPVSLDRLRATPRGIIAHNLLLSSVLLCSIWMTITTISSRARRAIRRRRSQCVECGYICVGHDRCPECGTRCE